MPDPLFVLASPRSFTSLIGGMLGQHPQTYGLPEVNLCVGARIDGGTLAERDRPPALGTAGLLRVLAQLHDGQQTEEAVLRAQQWIEEHPTLTGKEMFAYIQDLVGPDKMLIDKSPQNAVVGAVLQNGLWGNLPVLLEMFPNANFLHLVRHPRATCLSSRAIRDEHAVEGTRSRKIEGEETGYNPERVWMLAQSNVEAFSRMVRPDQFARIRGEDLLRAPKLYLRQICEWLGLDTGDTSLDAMLHPEDSPYAFVGPPSAQYGADPNFLKHPSIDFGRLAKIKDHTLDGEMEWAHGPFPQPIVQLARTYGYN